MYNYPVYNISYDIIVLLFSKYEKNVFYFLGVKYTAYKLVWILSPFLCHLARVPPSLPPKQTSFLCLPSQTDRQYLNSVRRRN